MNLDGRGSFQNSPDLKDFVKRGVRQGRNRFILDLQRCQGLDSTFMGTLSCVSGMLEDAEGWLHVANAVGRNGELLRGLGLDQVFLVEDGMEQAQRETHGATAEYITCWDVPRKDCSKIEQREVCLDAHVALADLDPANANKFRDVISLMRREVHPAAVR
ncbi:MAG: anti-anti-sigma factor [Verrucomicrobiales bacterium]|nr:anti-anti-sigma factor [Verrucomicrobiales bacterium]